MISLRATVVTNVRQFFFFSLRVYFLVAHKKQVNARQLRLKGIFFRPFSSGARFVPEVKREIRFRCLLPLLRANFTRNVSFPTAENGENYFDFYVCT